MMMPYVQLLYDAAAPALRIQSYLLQELGLKPELELETWPVPELGLGLGLELVQQQVRQPQPAAVQKSELQPAEQR
jgi:hypothetical protein